MRTMKLATIFIISAMLFSCRTLEPFVMCDLDLGKDCRCFCYSPKTLKQTDKRECYKEWELYREHSEELFEVYDEDYYLPISSKEGQRAFNLNVSSCNFMTVIKNKTWATKILPWAKTEMDNK